MQQHVRRDMEAALSAQLAPADGEIVLVSGARQTGKTSVLTNLVLERPRLVVNLWDESREIQALRSAATLEQFTQYLAALFGFSPGGGTTLIVDEAQGSPHLGKFLMQLHRTWERQRVVLSGSLLSHLFVDNVPMPVGRVVEYVMRPLNFREFLRFHGQEAHLTLLPPPGAPVDPALDRLLADSFDRYLAVGGLPGIVGAQRDGRDSLLLFESLVSNYYRDADRYLCGPERQPRTRAVQYGSLLEHCLKTVARHVAFATTNSTILSTDSAAYRVVLPRLLEALRSWHLVHTLEYEAQQSTSKRGYSSKKYLFDTGIMNFLMTRGMPVSAASDSATVAQLLENAVCQELVAFAGSTRAVNAYRANNKLATELDFVLRTGARVIPIEVKAADHVTQKALHQMLDFMRTHHVRRGIVVYRGQPCRRVVDDLELWFLPGYYLGTALAAF